MIILKDLLKVCPMQTRFLIQDGGYTKYVSPSKINKLEISTMLMKLKPYFYFQVVKLETTNDSSLLIVTLKELTKVSTCTRGTTDKHTSSDVDDEDDDVDGDGYDE